MQILSALTGESFVSVRPSWLKNPLTGKNLELDAYNKKLQLALEYNGRQHYEFVPRFHKTKDDLAYQVYRDELKKTLCDQQGITLIIVPYTIQKYQLCSYILGKLLTVSSLRTALRQAVG